MTELPGVHRAMLYERSAELELSGATQLRDILALVNHRVDLRKVELLEPSLHSIFMSTVGEPVDTQTAGEVLS